ncbi:MAG: SMP-30/gluconolactonase/LRE family protein [Bacteroidota bacterium]
MTLGPPSVIATGFRWAEGPLWVDRLGGLLISDVKANTIWRLRPEADASESSAPEVGDGAWSREVFLRPSGTDNPHPPAEEHGANGLGLDAEGRVVLCSHGERGVFTLDEDRWTKRPLVLRYRGQRLNSPNDLARHPTSGAVYITDPPYGLAGTFDDPRRETSHCGIYRVCADTGAVTLASDALEAPNGIAFAPDGRTAYATDSRPPHGRFAAFEVAADGIFGPPQTLLALPEATYETGMPDGLAVAPDGTLLGAGPDGIYRFDPNGAHRETLVMGSKVSNMAFGEGGEALFATAGDRVLRLSVGP